MYDKSVLAQDSLQKQLALLEGTKPRVPVEVTVTNCLTEFMNKDCKDIVNLLSYNIPHIKIMATAIEPGSTTVVFLIDKAFMKNRIHSSRKMSSLLIQATKERGYNVESKLKSNPKRFELCGHYSTWIMELG